MQKILVVILFVAAAIFGAFMFWKKQTVNEKQFIAKKPGLKSALDMLEKSGVVFKMEIAEGTFADGEHPVTFTIDKNDDRYAPLSQNTAYAKFLKFGTNTETEENIVSVHKF
jgi:uncharacterized protein YxeA